MGRNASEFVRSLGAGEKAARRINLDIVSGAYLEFPLQG